jgi:hypothetical protein
VLLHRTTHQLVREYTTTGGIVIKAEVQKRGIQHVLHFTKIENLLSITQNGLIPRANLDTHNIAYRHNDEIRVDRCENASCLSISFPNYKMFYSYRMHDPAQEWVVISLSPRLLWEKDCAFCYSNAASSEISSIPVSERKRPEAFLKMFDDFDSYPKRSELKIQDCHTTNPQAEVLVFEVIEPNYFQGMFFQNQKTIEALQQNMGPLNKLPFRCGGKAFAPRGDYEYWKAPRAEDIINDFF